MPSRKVSEKKKSCSKCLVVWDFLNKPLIVALMFALISSILFLKFGYKEKVKCNFMINPDVDYLINKEKMDNDSIHMLIELYSKPFLANLTFDDYQEALAFKYLIIDGQNHGKWYKPTLDCFTSKIELPIKAKEIFNKY